LSGTRLFIGRHLLVCAPVGKVAAVRPRALNRYFDACHVRAAVYRRLLDALVAAECLRSATKVTAPALGANTEEVLADLLGFDSAAIGHWHYDGIVASAL